MLKAIKSFLAVVDNQTYFVTVCSLIATYLCDIYEIRADLPSGLIGIAIIFPIVFSINAAYKRREDVLKYFASLKAHGVALYLATPIGLQMKTLAKTELKSIFFHYFLM